MRPGTQQVDDVDGLSRLPVRTGGRVHRAGPADLRQLCGVGKPRFGSGYLQDLGGAGGTPAVPVFSDGVGPHCAPPLCFRPGEQARPVAFDGEKIVPTSVDDVLKRWCPGSEGRLR